MMPEPLVSTELTETPGRPFPWFCPRCRRKDVRRVTIPYQCQRRYKGQPITLVISDLAVPQCQNCGELVFDYVAEEQINRAFDEQTAGFSSGANGTPSHLTNGTTPYHAVYYAHDLTRRSSSDSVARIGSSLLNATIDLNPHQVDAALFAFRALPSRGALLADEVGLGKTIEAGLVISQLWAEHKRRILIIAPAILRKQWAQELAEKFFIGSQVIDRRELNAARKEDRPPFDRPGRVLIASYHFVAAQQAPIANVPWDLVVIDEAHRLRNVYKPGNKIANAIRDAVRGRPLILLTATPLQNDLLELYGLVSFLDDHVFGDVQSFRANYKQRQNLDELRQRLRPLCQRTLRRQVSEYVPFTNRVPFTQDFTPTEQEEKLYDQVSNYLQRDQLNALPSGQRQLMTLVLRKLLASSTYAIAGTLESLARRLEQKHIETAPPPEVLEDFEPAEALTEEWSDAPEPLFDAPGTGAAVLTPLATPRLHGAIASLKTHHYDLSPPEPAAPSATATTISPDIQAEIQELQSFGRLAASITTNAKAVALLQALGQGFDKMAQLGAARKAVIFTESRRTQAYLFDLLEKKGYAGKLLTINGTNNDDRSGAIYKAWLKHHAGEEIITGNKSVDLRAALVEHFRDHAEVLLATEAAAEGVNLQFCSLVINYDLPWNPQRIEQRIGRCHRYGQKHDVVVVNFLNRKNAADERVFELLSEKFKLFEGVFGSSDEVLGALESGVDFERRIAAIYQMCRGTDAINRAFDKLRAELEEQIKVRMADTRRMLLEHFDEEVHQRLKVKFDESHAVLDNLERSLWELTKFELAGQAKFHAKDYSFDLQRLEGGWPEVPPGTYQFISKARAAAGDGKHPYRPGHPLAESAILRAKSRPVPVARLVFDYSNHPGPHIGLLRELRGRSGWLLLDRFSVHSLENEDRLLFAAIDEEGKALHPEFCEKLFRVTGKVAGPVDLPTQIAAALSQQREHLHGVALADIGDRNKRYFEQEIDKLDRWADDLKEGLEREIKELNAEITQAGREARLVPDLQGKLALQSKKKELETTRKRKQRELFDAQDEIEARKEKLIVEVETRLQQHVEHTELFTIAWEVR